MESEINKQIRETLESFGVDAYSLGIKENLNLLGALASCFYNNRKEHYARVLSMVDSHGFMQFLMGEMEYREIKKPIETNNEIK